MLYICTASSDRIIRIMVGPTIGAAMCVVYDVLHLSQLTTAASPAALSTPLCVYGTCRQEFASRYYRDTSEIRAAAGGGQDQKTGPSDSRIVQWPGRESIDWT